MKVTCIYWPEDRERMLFKRAIRVTMGDVGEPKKLPSSKLVRDALNARHSPIRVLNFAFLIEDVPSNISVHLCRHVHAVPFVASLRNDRQVVSAARRAAEAASAAKRDAGSSRSAVPKGQDSRGPQRIARARGGIIDGDKAPRDTPVDMIFYCNAEELMVIANKRLCRLAAGKTRQVVQMMCLAALEKMPELKGLLVPMCVYHGGVCHEINGCGRCSKG